MSNCASCLPLFWLYFRNPGSDCHAHESSVAQVCLVSNAKLWYMTGSIAHDLISVICAHAQAEKQATVANSYAECEKLIAQYKAGKLELQPGCNMDESLEALVTGSLNGIRDTASRVSSHNFSCKLNTCQQ